LTDFKNPSISVTADSAVLNLEDLGVRTPSGAIKLIDFAGDIVLKDNGLHIKKLSTRINNSVFKVTGEVRKPKLKTQFAKEVLAEKPEHAVERVYAEIGSKHRVKRVFMMITAVEEISTDEIKNPVLKKIVIGE
jgi:large subunit ribosomal protein LX